MIAGAVDPLRPLELTVRTVCHELLDRTIIWNERQIRALIVEYIDHYNQHRPHRSLNQRAPSVHPATTMSPRSGQANRSHDTPPAVDSSTTTAPPPERRRRSPATRPSIRLLRRAPPDETPQNQPARTTQTNSRHLQAPEGFGQPDARHPPAGLAHRLKTGPRDVAAFEGGVVNGRARSCRVPWTH